VGWTWGVSHCESFPLNYTGPWWGSISVHHTLWGCIQNIPDWAVKIIYLTTKRVWKLPTSILAHWLIRHGSPTIYQCFALPQLLYRWWHQSGIFWIHPRIYRDGATNHLFLLRSEMAAPIALTAGFRSETSCRVGQCKETGIQEHTFSPLQPSDDYTLRVPHKGIDTLQWLLQHRHY
jgi:hypothetical protein